MKFIIIAVIAICSVAVSANEPEIIEVIRNDQNINPDGSYQYEYETENGIKGQEQGLLKNAGTDEEAQVAQGSYSYISPEGEEVRIEYIADENGFQPQGKFIPTPPPIPPAIQRALEYLASHPPTEETRRK